MSQLKALILDKDGTLFPYSLWAGPMRRALSENLPVGRRSNRDEIVASFLSVLAVRDGKIGSGSLLFDRKKRIRGAVKLIALTLRYHLNPYRALRGFLTLRDRYFYGFEEELSKYDLTDVRNTLLNLEKKGIILALFSNDCPASVKIVTGALSPVSFSYYVDSSSRIRKPNPYAVRVFAEINGIRCDEIAFLSDTSEDLIMARRAGCGKVIAIEGTMKRDDLESYADAVISEIGEIEDFFVND